MIVLVTTLKTTSGHGPKPCMDLDFTHAIKTSGTTRKITRMCAVVPGRYCKWVERSGALTPFTNSFPLLILNQLLYSASECIRSKAVCTYTIHMYICDWIWQNPASTHKASLRDMEILSNHCVVTSQCLKLCKRNLHQLFIYLLAITVWAYKLLTPNNALFWAAFFEQVIVSQVVVIGVVGGLNIGVLNEGRRQMESRDQVIALCGSSLYTNHSKLSDITAGKLSAIIINNSNKAMAFEWHQSSTHGFHRVRKMLQQKQTCYLSRKYSVLNESILDQ